MIYANFLPCHHSAPRQQDCAISQCEGGVCVFMAPVGERKSTFMDSYRPITFVTRLLRHDSALLPPPLWNQTFAIILFSVKEKFLQSIIKNMCICTNADPLGPIHWTYRRMCVIFYFCSLSAGHASLWWSVNMVSELEIEISESTRETILNNSNKIIIALIIIIIIIIIILEWVIVLGHRWFISALAQ